MTPKPLILIIALSLSFSIMISPIIAQKVSISEDFIDNLVTEYKHLHAHPELSFLEEKTSARLAEKMKTLGYQVTENVGGYGVVAVMKNGPGKTLLVRADTDALPIMENTGADYASTVKMTDITGDEVSVMHACGHDMHMTVWLGTAQYLAANKGQWSGTTVFIAQPAEERAGGAKAMIKEGLYSKFPLPGYAIALHVNANMPAGTVGYRPGYAMASVDMVDILVKGIGGHGAYPHKTKDPIVIAAHLILELQTIVSREISPLESGVVTVGAIHGGTKGNVIPDEVELKLTLRSYTDENRKHIIDAIRRKCEAVAISAGLPEELYPEITIRDERTSALFNDAMLANSIIPRFKMEIGSENVREVDPVMAGEDFSEYGITEEEIPIFLYWLGAVKKEKYDQAMKENLSLPSLHSSSFLPDPKPTISTGVRTMSGAVLELLKKN